jgi:1,4-dihydroxy-2-naphthoate octaprenyltransferase
MNAKVIFASLRAPFFTGVIVPVALGSILAWYHTGNFFWGYFILTMIGAIALHAGANTINDYFDHFSGNDPVNREYVRPFTGGSRLIQNKNLTAKGMLTISLTCYAIAIAIGLFLVGVRGWPILIMGVIGVASGIMYVAPWVNLAAHGVGEVAVAMNFGVLSVLGAYYVQAQRLSWEAVLASVPVGLLITAILWINEFPDFNADKAVGKTHWVVRLGRKKSAFVFTIMMGLVYASIILLGLLYPSRWVLIGLLTLPLSIKVVVNALKHYDQIPLLVPSNAGTVMAHMLTGVLLCVGYLLNVWI